MSEKKRERKRKSKGIGAGAGARPRSQMGTKQSITSGPKPVQIKETGTKCSNKF